MASLLPRFWLCVALLLFVATARAQQAGKSEFDLPSGFATKTFKLFSEQSGRGLIADAKLVKEVRTRPVRGSYTPSDALARMLAGTGLLATEDPQNGAFVVHREIPDPNASRTAPPTTGDRPKKQPQAVPPTVTHL